MMSNSFKKIASCFAVVVFILPLSFAFLTPRAEAAGPVTVVGGWGTIQESISAIANPSTAASTLGLNIQNTILMPLARAIARMILMQITASTINWINGANGTGKPSFVLNLSVHLQSVADAVAMPLIAKAATGFNSPFGPAISASLQNNYLQQSSMAGFYAANQCTLAQSSSNPNAFLAGDWSKGGVNEWFALTAPNQNNPYILNQIAKSQVDSNIAQAQTNQRQELQQSGGFLSWCGTTAAAAQTQSQASGGYQACIAQCNANGYTAACADNCTTSFSQSGGTMGGATSYGANPGATCTNADGTPGKVQTPGSFIHDYTQAAVVNSGINQLISAQDLDAALGAIVMALGKQALGGINGLLGASSPSGLTSQMQSFLANNAAAAASATSLAQSTLTQIGNYTTAWDTIVAAANTASASVTTLASACPSQANPAQTALVTEISPVLAQAQRAFTTASTTKAFALKVQAEASVLGSSSVTSGSAGTVSADTQTLAAMPPSITDVATAQSNAMVSGSAAANPPGSLTVSGGSIVDQMNLITANAAVLDAICNPPTTPAG